MLLKALGENSVKVLMEDQDIERYNLPFEKLNYDDPHSRAFIYELIKKSYEQTGINFQDCRLMVEVIPGFSRAYYILITKLDGEGSEEIEFDKAEVGEPETLTFRLENAMQVYRFFEILEQTPPQKSTLYYYNGSYYTVLEFSVNNTLANDMNLKLKQLEEYGGRCRYCYENEAFLTEKGEYLAGPDVFRQLFKKFG